MADHPVSQRTADQPVQVRFELMRSLHMAVEVKINGAGPFRLIFDLGAPVVLISGNAARQAGLISPEAAARPAFFGLRGQAKVEKFQIGPLIVPDVPVVIMDHPTIRQAAKILGPIDGIVGYPAFSRYRFAIDYQHSTISFAPGSYQPIDAIEQTMRRMLLAAVPEPPIASAALWGLNVKKDTGDRPGVVVQNVWPQSAAHAGGLRTGDRLLTIDRRWTDTVSDTLRAASSVAPAQAVRVRIRRNGRQLELTVRPRLGL